MDNFNDGRVSRNVSSFELTCNIFETGDKLSKSCEEVYQHRLANEYVCSLGFVPIAG